MNPKENSGGLVVTLTATCVLEWNEMITARTERYADLYPEGIDYISYKPYQQ